MKIEATQEGTSKWEAEPAQEECQSGCFFSGHFLFRILEHTIQLWNSVLDISRIVPKRLDLHLLICLQYELATTFSSSDNDSLRLFKWLIDISVRQRFVDEQNLSGMRSHIQRLFFPCEWIWQVIDYQVILACSEYIIDSRSCDLVKFLYWNAIVLKFARVCAFAW